MKPEVYLICHEFSPTLGSECKSGWNIALELSSVCHLNVIAASTNQWGTEHYKKQVMQDPLSNKFNMIWVDQPQIFHRPQNFGSNPITQFLYFLRLKKWSRSVCEILKSHDIQILHYYNHISYRAYYTGFSDLSNSVYIGPISGYHNIPCGFLKFGFRQNIKIITRNIFNTINSYASRRKFKHKSIKHIFCVTKDDKSALKTSSKHLSILSDMAVNSNIEEYDKTPFAADLNKDKLQLLWVGRLDNLKCLDILLKVFENCKPIRGSFRLVILGDGPNRMKYEAWVKKLNCDIQFKGKVSQRQVTEYMKKSDLLLQTSLKEASGAVIFEALGAKLPVACHRAFGYTDLLRDEFSIQIEYISFKKSVDGFTSALLSILNDESKLTKLKNSLLVSHTNMTWNDNAKIIQKCYER